MTVFWLVATLLLLGALLMLLPPLWSPRLPATAPTSAGVNLALYRAQVRETEQDLHADLLAPEHAQQARTEIQRRLLEDTPRQADAATPLAARRSALLLALLIPLGSVSTYLALGGPQSLQDGATTAGAKPDSRHSVSREQIEQMVTSLANRLRSEPDNAEGWMMLARSYSALARYRDAVIAFRRAAALAPGNASLLADFADVLGMAQGKRLAGEPALLIQKALDIDPRHVKALALAGSVAFEAQDFPAARGYWERLVAVVPPESDIARSIQGSIAQTRQREQSGSATAGPRPAAPAAAAAPPAAPGATLAVAGEVQLGEALAAQVRPGDTLFIFARAAQGPRMPLAIIKRPVGAWPAPFRLDDTLAMAPELRLSGFGQVVVSARISRSGNATPQSGDLVGQGSAVAPGVEGLRIVIDRVQP